MFQVGYATALDVFIVICFVMVFAALMEFAFLNFLDTLVRRLKKKEAERRNLAVSSSAKIYSLLPCVSFMMFSNF